MHKKKIVILLVVGALVGGFFASGLGEHLSFANLKAHQAEIAAAREAHPVLAALAYLAIYVAVTALSLPGAAILTLAGGAVFGLLWGTVVVSFASTIGATLAFVIARVLLRDWVKARFGDSLRAIDAGVEKDGPFYLFTLRLVPAFPFFVINLVMALTPLRTFTFAWVSQLGMLPGTVVFVNAGTQLAALESPGDVLSPGLVASFVLLGLFPLLARKITEGIRARRVYQGWSRPARFERDMVVIGAGSAGLVTAYIGAAARARVTLVEKHRMGGDCLNTGCVPSKALIRSARFLADARRAESLGMRRVEVDFDFGEVMDRVRRVVETVAPHDSVDRYASLGVECLQGEAQMVTPWEVRVGARTITTRSIVIAAGARPFVPPIEGLERARWYTSDTLWDMRELPARLVVLGGGPIGCELAQCFARFGSRVDQVEMLPRVLVREDPEVSALVAGRLAAEGVSVRTGHRALRVEVEGAETVLVCERDGDTVRIPFDAMLVAVGRVANTEGYGLDTLGIGLTARGTVEVDGSLRTRFPNVLACGDVAGPYQFTHMAAHQAWYAATNALFGRWWRQSVDESVVPWATFTEPEVARVGLNEQDARERGIAYEVTTYDLADLDRAIADESAEGLVKVLTVPGKDRVLGVTIVGDHAGDLAAEFGLAMRARLGLGKILSTIHVYPTLAEANKHAAGAWRRAHQPGRLLALLERYHAWSRGD
ncbi:MAG: FAD-dependent oxidoreductase [Ectothiorhodospiraceae bacterium]|nr:FAD-dependent oxidoreductase [Chromatiales bacterium]MCP5155740.1 FAD-dependent oxidoreductase [Ectothiorhodospiraceae bacterium]